MPDEPPKVRVHFLPQFVAEYDLAESTVVIVDLLRASTTICHALAAGATELIPFVKIAETAQAAAGYDRRKILLGGERGGEIIEGFDLGNSPSEYTAEIVFGQTILFTTTNGTKALQYAHLARRVVLGAMANLSILVESLQRDRRIEILCAGTGGHVTREDILAAGAIVCGLVQSGLTLQLNDSAAKAEREWAELLTTARVAGRSVESQLAQELRETQGGKNLLAIGHDADLATCAQIDTCSVVPELDVAGWRIYVQ